MKIKKLSVDERKIDLNFIFYVFLKELNGSNALSALESDRIFSRCSPLENNYTAIINVLEDEIEGYRSAKKKQCMLNLLEEIKTPLILEIFIFSLRLIRIKSLLLEESRLIQLVNSEKNHGHYLSLCYDNFSKNRPYYTRVNGALLALLFFEKIESKQCNFMTKESEDFLQRLSEQAVYLKSKGIEPNQIFMLMFTESMNQSIISSAGISYEERLKSVLISIGIDGEKIKKVHDEADKSTEYDFFFELNGKNYGIGAKRTLRERYKQFIKTSLTTDIDVIIEVTLGTDLSEEKAKNIRQHGTYLFVADEVYNQNVFLQKMEGVYKGSDMTYELLLRLGKMSNRNRRLHK